MQLHVHVPLQLQLRLRSDEDLKGPMNFFVRFRGLGSRGDVVQDCFSKTSLVEPKQKQRGRRMCRSSLLSIWIAATTQRRSPRTPTSPPRTFEPRMVKFFNGLTEQASATIGMGNEDVVKITLPTRRAHV